MTRKKLFIALPLAIAVVVAGSVVWASVNETPARACANIIRGHDKYTAPVQSKDVTGNATWTTPGSLEFTMTLQEATCLDVQYGVVVLGEDPYDPDKEPPTRTPTVLASSSVPGDGVSNKVAFDLEVNERTAQGKVCIYGYTIGGSGTSSTGKTGAAFDATSAALLDRAPDGPTAKSGDLDAAEAYCFYVTSTGSGGRTYN